MNYLELIVARKRHEVSRRKRYASLYACSPVEDALYGKRAMATLRRDQALHPKVIAEIKLKSPSAGILRERHAGQVTHIAKAYETAGAAAVSVLCDASGFGGTPLDVRRVSQVVKLPILFKEFVIDPIQLDLARVMGAHLVLLIVASLDQPTLRELVHHTRQRGMEAVVEVFDEAELERALDAGASIVGVNARDLRTFRVDHSQALAVVSAIPKDKVSVFMSGIDTAASFKDISKTGVDAVLIGESLIRSPSPGQKLKELVSG